MTAEEKRYLALAKEEEETEELVDISKEEEPLHSLLEKNGKYYWLYEQPMLKSFFLLFEVWRVMGLAGLIVLMMMALLIVVSGAHIDAFFGMVGVTALCLGIILVISLPAYYIVTKANDGHYTVLFEMDDDGIDHIQIKTDKAKALDALTMLAGSATGNYTLKGIGSLNASGGSLYSSFRNVRKIKADRKKGVIALNGRLLRNQVYVDDENFDFVYQFIREHCPNARDT